MASIQRITPCLWFDQQAEEAARFYSGIFPNSHIVAVSRYGKAGHEIHRRPAGSIMTVAFELDRQPFTALNGGPEYKFTPAVSFVVRCETQQEVDHYWSRLSAGGEEIQCGWLRDKFGLSWQITPTRLPELIRNPKAFQAMLQMKKIDVAELERAAQS